MLKRSIEVRGLRFEAHVGLAEHERNGLQPLQFDLVVEVDEGEVDPESGLVVDEISQTVNYVEVVELIKVVVQRSRRKLLETMAQEICGLILELPMARSAEVFIVKLAPPLDEVVTYTAARVHMTKDRETGRQPS